MSEFSVNSNDGYKRNYHPLIILLYTSGMLTSQQIKQLPRTTQYNWNRFKNESYDGHEWAMDYIKKFDDIKSVYRRKHTYATVRFICKVSDGYQHILKGIESNKKLVKQSAKGIALAIGRVVNDYSIKVNDACKFYGVSSNWYYREKSKISCKRSVINKCFLQHPNQLTITEMSSIEKIILNPISYGKTMITLYHQGLREGVFFCCVSTFRKYAHLVGYQKRAKIIKPRKLGLRASKVFEWLHVDVTLVHTVNDGIQRVAFVKDNFSKAILHYQSTDGKADSSFIRSLFQETFEKYRLFDFSNPIHILSDGGSENKGVFLDWINEINAPPIVTKITAKTVECHFSNSMSESTHSIFKTEFLKGKIADDKHIHLKYLDEFVSYYNYQRFPTDLYGYSPMEVVKGAIPDKYRFKESIAKAKIARRTVNKEFNECNQPFRLCNVYS